MKIKRYIATDMRQALKQVREEQGPDAVILSTRHLEDGLELIAAIDYDETLVQFAMGGAASRPSRQPSDRTEGHSGAASRFDEGEPELPRPEADRAEVGGQPDQRAMSRSGERAARSEAEAQPGRGRSRPDGGGPGADHESTEAPGPGPVPESSLSSVRREINVLKRMLETQMSSLAWNDLSRRSPLRAAALRDLIRMGVSPDLAQELAGRAPVRDDDSAATWRGALGGLARRLKVPEHDPLADGGVVALVGPTGVGKTTTIAKLAARYALKQGLENMALISADDYRIGAQEQLFIYGRQLNVPVYVARNPEELRQRIEGLSHVDLILVDTAGVSQRDTRLVRALEPLQCEGRPVASYLVLAANAQLEALDEAVAAFSHIPLAGSVVTKLDEAVSLGGVLSVLARHGLAVTWATDGQEVPENIRRASARHLISQAVGLMRKQPREHRDAALTRHIIEARYANA